MLTWGMASWRGDLSLHSKGLVEGTTSPAGIKLPGANFVSHNTTLFLRLNIHATPMGLVWCCCVLEVLETWIPEECVVGYGGQMASQPPPVGVAWSTPGLPCLAFPAPVLLSLLAPWPAGSLPPSPASSEPSVSFLFLFCLENKGTPCCQGE